MKAVTKLESYNEYNLIPKIDDEELKKYLPKNLVPQKIEFILSDANNAIANALRRTITGESPVNILDVQISDIVTNDPFIIQEMIISRIRMIPLLQSCHVNNEFELIVENNSVEDREIKSGEIKYRARNSGEHDKGARKMRDNLGESAPLPFNETFTLFTLHAGNQIKISPIKIITEYGFNEGFGMCALGINAVSWPIDVDINNTPSSLSALKKNCPKKWRVSFITNGIAPGKEIIDLACNEIIKRLYSLLSILFQFTVIDEINTLDVPGESHTIGNLIIRTIYQMEQDNNLDISAYTYSADIFSRGIKFRIKYSGDIIELFENIINYNIEIFKKIRYEI